VPHEVLCFACMSQNELGYDRDTQIYIVNHPILNT